MNKRHQYTGQVASPGVAVGPVWIYRPLDVRWERYTIDKPSEELNRLYAAMGQARDELQLLEARARENIGDAEAAIFEAHQMFLDDPDLLEAIQTYITKGRINAEAAVYDAAEDIAKQLEEADYEYFRARATDIRDVSRRLIRCLLGVSHDIVNLPRNPVIVLAEDLTPSDTVQFNKNLILGLITVQGGPTSHTAILARSLGIPALVSVPLRIEEVLRDAMVVLDAVSGSVIIKPTEAELNLYRDKRVKWLEEQSQQLAQAMKPAITTDGKQVEIVANIGDAADARVALDYGAEGVGLFRTEFLYLDRSQMATEEEQYQAYCEVIEVMGQRPLVVRTFDIGGDKAVPYIGFPDEMNPFLGWRGIRMIDRHADVLETQFRALLRAGVKADLRIMIPMVSNLDEIKMARAILDRAIESLRTEKTPFAQKVQFGIMIEVPSAALIAHHLADHVDFFSIGTNDLTQYTLAVDRTNPHVASLGDTFHPAVLLLIQKTIEAAHAKGKWVGLCGEFAGRPQAVPILLGLGLDEFSMSATAIPAVKACIRSMNLSACREFAQRVLAMATAAEVRSACEDFIASVAVAH